MIVVVVTISPFVVAWCAFLLEKIVLCETLSQPSYVPLVVVGSLEERSYHEVCMFLSALCRSLSSRSDRAAYYADRTSLEDI
jgi:hypothetical protein